jgi:predicted metal-dependent phosphoesterase TrpH
VGGADLHIHTTASDGLLTAAEVVREAEARGLAAIAITDHDTTAGIDQALEAADVVDLEVIPGIELSAELDTEEVHILGYYLNHRDGALQEKLGMLRRARWDRARRMVEKLARLGISVSWERVVEIAGESRAFGRPHIAHALQEGRHVATTNEAFNLYIGLGGPAYVSRYKLTLVEALEIILAAGGLPVLAHPRGQGRLLHELVAAGLVGLEAYYPSYTVEESEGLVRLAAQHDLIPTGGSDFHGQGGCGAAAVGDVWVPRKSVERLQSLASGRAGEVASLGEQPG